jgi:ribonuclease Z
MQYVLNRDAMPEAIAGNLQAYSWSFSHFFLWRGGRILFDCGEGTAIRLDSHVFRAEVLALSHAHSDHCRGLLGFLEARAGLKGDNEKPLTIVYPAESAAMTRWIDPAKGLCERRGLEFVTFHPIRDGESVGLRNQRQLTARVVPHQPGETCLAYRIGRTRSRLKEAYRALAGPEIATLARTMPQHELKEDYVECELAYSGDTEHLDPAFCMGAQVLIHEASFLDAADADAEKGIHADVPTALQCAIDANVRALVLFHGSRRYGIDMFIAGIRAQIESMGVSVPVVLIRGSYSVLTD